MRRMGEIGWVIGLAGLPFAHFLVYAWLDRWQAQTVWMHLWVMALSVWMIAWASRAPIPNRPLAAWFGWLSACSLWTWGQFLTRDQYPLLLLMPWMHGIALVAAYLSATACWTRATLQELLCWLARVGLVNVLYGYLQWAGLDQFYRQADAWTSGDAVVGLIGNQMHFSVYLALLLPIFLWRRTWAWGGVALAAGGLILRSGSATGSLCAGVAVAWWAWRAWPQWTWALLGVAACGGALWALLTPGYLDPHGRVETWSRLWSAYLSGEGKRQITGVGLGHLMAASTLQPPTGAAVWRHAHSEWLQALIEQGVIGVGLLGWIVAAAIRRIWRHRRDAMMCCLGGVFAAFLVSSLTGFPAHLWVLGSLALTAYGGVYVLTAEEEARPMPSRWQSALFGVS